MSADSTALGSVRVSAYMSLITDVCGLVRWKHAMSANISIQDKSK